MATKSSGFLVTLGKKILGFSTSSTGCCATPAATAEDQGAGEVAGQCVLHANRGGGGGRRLLRGVAGGGAERLLRIGGRHGHERGRAFESVPR